MVENKNVRKLRKIIKKYLANQATPTESEFVESYYDHFGGNPSATENLSEEEKAGISARIWGSISQSTEKMPVIVPFYRKPVFRYVAAAVLIGFTAGILFWNNSANKSTPQSSATATTIVPGSNKAVITLSDGSTIVLEDAANGAVATDGNAIIEKKDGTITYKQDGAAEKLQFNTINIPKGGQFSLTLSDGSKVWLNSASSLTYPTAFRGNERVVTLSGEGYFEVASNKAKPFKVQIAPTAGGTPVSTVIATGTQFNIKAYANESAHKTTLVEGIVTVTTQNNGKLTLKPGQQAIQKEGEPMKLDENPEIGEVIAWKNGLFWMNQADIPSVMRQLERWYDVEIVYRNGIPKGTISGKLPMNMELDKLLDALQLSGIKIEISGRKLLISE